MSIYLGEKIKSERKKKGLLQKDLCCEGITKSTISKIEGNTLIPSLLQLEQICKILKIELFELFLDENKAYSINEDKLSIDLNIQKQTNIEDDFTNIKALYENKEFFRIIELYSSPTQCTHFTEAYYTGMSYFAISEFLSTQKYLKRTISLFKSIDRNYKNLYSENLANCFNTLGKICFMKKDFKKSTHYFHKGKITLESFNINNTELYSTLINNIGNIYCFSGEYKKTIIVLENFLNCKSSAQYFKILAYIHVSLNISFYKLCNYEKAINHIEKAIFFYDYVNMHFEMGECHLNYVNALKHAGRFNDAFKILDQCIKSFSDVVLINMFKIKKIELFYNMNNYDSINKLSKEIDLKNLRDHSLKDLYFILGHTEFINGNYKKSHAYYNKCMSFLLKHKKYLDLSVLYKDLATILVSTEFLEKSLEFKNLSTSIEGEFTFSNSTI